VDNFGSNNTRAAGLRHMLQIGQKARILILTALPQEYSPLRKLFPSWRLVRKRPLKKFAFNLPGKEITLVEAGMGPNSVKEALSDELSRFSPDLLMFCGFAGGLHPDLTEGVVCYTHSAREISSEEVFKFRVSQDLSDFIVQNQIRPVFALSADGPVDKQMLSCTAVEQPAVLDMETATVAELASQNKIPFVCFRAVSDAVDRDLGFNLSDISDERGRVRLAGVLGTIIRKPSALKAFYLSWRRSRLAARNLCGSVAAFLHVLPAMSGKIEGETQ
jgi:nucleoside phosphorylase